jgi:hypothetical protein
MCSPQSVCGHKNKKIKRFIFVEILTGKILMENLNGILDVVPGVTPGYVAVNTGAGGWEYFESMVTLGREHALHGAEHLLLLMLMLIPATMVVKDKRWVKFGGTKYSLVRLVKMAAAFTAGHSLTLVLGATGLISLPYQFVNICIAITIFISAIHAVRPLYPGKELYFALGFGLVNGLAFSSVFDGQLLPTGQMGLSIIGFNTGIELVQLFVICVTMPWLILLSVYRSYGPVRLLGALIGVVASVAWLFERATGRPNTISMLVQTIADNWVWILLGLACMTYIGARLDRYLVR